VHFELAARPLVVFPSLTRRGGVFHTSAVTACFSPFFFPAASAISFGKVEENSARKENGMLDEKGVQIMWKNRGESADSLCNGMCKACGYPAANRRRTGGKRVEIANVSPVRNLLKFC